jgi:hypothetical protein
VAAHRRGKLPDCRSSAGGQQKFHGVEPAAILRDRGRDSQRDLLYLLRVAGDPVLGGEHAGEYAVIIPVHQRAPFRGATGLSSCRCSVHS